MALYIPAGTRRRRTILFAVAALIVGLLGGLAIGRQTAPTVQDRISEVRSDAKETAAGLRVIALHDEATAVGSAGGDGGTALVLRRTRSELEHEFDRASWLGSQARTDLLHELQALAARPTRTDTSFAKAAEHLARSIETTFGVTTS